ncbi:MAG: hypothetical protein QGH45_24865 [Myxococcota bacterium]|nr:hypothetical protein [Myxococcota bacterium]
MKTHWTWFGVAILGAALAGCPGDDDDDDSSGDDDTTAADDDTGDDDTGDDDTGDDDTGDDDTGDDDTTTTGTGLLGCSGTATAGPGIFAGSEDLYLVADKGAGEDVCRVQYDLDTTADRDDCVDCDWAHDLERTSATALAWEHPDCATLLGLDSDDVSMLDGTAVSYGYIDEYFGHASVLSEYTANLIWEVVGFASYDVSGGTLVYDLEDGFIGY